MELHHHAYLIEGDRSHVEPLIDRLYEAGIAAAQSPDLFVHTCEQLMIADARMLRERAAGKPMIGEKLVLVVACRSITREAQNALLKTFEEPAAKTVFFLITPSADLLLPTLRSRVEVMIGQGRETPGESSFDAGAFLAATPSARIPMLKSITDDKDRASASALLTELEARLSDAVDSKEARRGLRSVYTAKRYMNDNGASLKILLEHVALLVPRM